jgi:cellulose synthase/poly-beta-1,6-N-acetylglucosamine synthase-like glycosyltransferase/peptidoglycan/xylan/chitin deacetylase (PgdA/CDA1 family)/spore germination protein YaaH
MRKYPVFFDPDKKRWPRVKQGLFLSGLTVSILIGGLIASILIGPLLSLITLNSTNPTHVRVAPPLSTIFNAQRRREVALETRLSKEINAQKFVNRKNANPNLSTMTVGFYVNWDDASYDSLTKNLSNLDIVIGEWMHLATPDGNIVEDDPDKQKQATDYISAHKPDTKVLALINNYQNDGWQSDTLASMLSNKVSRSNNINGILNYVSSHNLSGASIDYEEVPVTAQNNLVTYMSELETVFHRNHLLVTINLPADDGSFDYKALTQNSDYVILMTYDQHWSSGTPGPIAGVDWFGNILQQRLKEIDHKKLIIALGNYAYDWAPGKEGKELSFEEAVLTARDSEGKIAIDPTSLNPAFEYYDEFDKLHQVWMLDATTIFNQLAVAEPAQPYGFALWRLGSEDPAIWKVFGGDGPFDSNAASDLKNIDYGYNIDYEGVGEVLRVVADPVSGNRTITFDDKRGLIVDENYLTLPSPYVINRYGGGEKKIALTFDDGPDPVYTSQILEALKKANVPATFFVIGENIDNNKKVLQKEYAYGNEIGNHTYSHPNIAHVSDLQLKLEVSATERLIEDAIGHQSHLFRSPYAQDSEPETVDEIKPVQLLNNLGYLTVGMHVDPNDWQKPGADQIVSRTVEQVLEGKGNIVLLHDSGGDRSQTVEALPLIISTLQAKGYKFVTVSDLIGKTRDDVMPVMTSKGNWERLVGRGGIGLISWIRLLISIFFYIGIILGILRLLFIIILAIVHKFRHVPPVLNPESKKLSVAVIVPAYNEEKVISQTLFSLLGADSDDFEIIVVDDGSTDKTAQMVQDDFGDNKRVKFFTISNSGKPDALNFGISKTNAEIIITLDADTVFTKDTITKLVQHFQDPKVGAVAGNTKVGNRINLMTRWQALEYITSQNLDRRAFAVINTITVVPGAVGAWRTTAVIEAGGFSPDTVAEDSDLTIKILQLGYKIQYEENAYGLTEAPDTVSGFLKQRYRWMFGTFQAAWKNKSILFKPKYKWLGMVALPNIFLFQILFPLISPFIDLLTIVLIVGAFVSKQQHPDQFFAGNLYQVLFYYSLFLAVDFITATIAFFMERKENKRLLVWLFPQRFFYRQLMYYVAIKSVFASLHGGEVGWNKVDRKGTVKH